jgi:predicted DNA-binding transcriptional regulator AlpA
MYSSKCVNTRQVALWLGVHPITVRRWRLQGRGPQWVRLGRAIRYRNSDVEEWIASRPRGGEEIGEAR